MCLYFWITHKKNKTLQFHETSQIYKCWCRLHMFENQKKNCYSNFAPKNPILSPKMKNQSITYNNLFSATFKNSMISKCSKYYCYALIYSTGLLSQLEKIHVHVWAVKYNKWSFFSVWKFRALSQLKKTLTFNTLLDR